MILPGSTIPIPASIFNHPLFVYNRAPRTNQGSKERCPRIGKREGNLVTIRDDFVFQPFTYRNKLVGIC